MKGFIFSLIEYTIGLTSYVTQYFVNIIEPLCDNAPFIDFGNINRFSPSLIEYSCAIGYTLVGPNERRCQDDLSWSNSEPRCQFSGTGEI